jgi:hypothetical protein
MVPLEEARVIDEILHQEIFCTGHEIRGFRDLVERGDRRAQDMEDGKGNLAAFGRFEESRYRAARRATVASSKMQTLVSLTDTSSPAKWSMLRFSF